MVLKRGLFDKFPTPGKLMSEAGVAEFAYYSIDEKTAHLLHTFNRNDYRFFPNRGDFLQYKYSNLDLNILPSQLVWNSFRMHIEFP